MLSGNNSILSRVTQAKDETEIAEEKETIKRAIMQSISKNKDRKLIQSDLQLEIGSDKANVYDDGDGFTILFKSKRIYTIDKERNIGGTISKYEEATKKFATEIADKNYGTEEKPYEINCIEDLVELSYKVNGIVVEENGTLTYTNTRNDFSGKHIVLTKNLNFKLPLSYEESTRKDYGDINGNGEVEELLTELTTGTGWIPIGGNDHGNFKGIFNGNNNEIKNVFINNENTNKNSGLFGDSTGASFNNLGVTGTIYCNSTGSVGGISASLFSGSIQNCYFNGTIENKGTSSSTGGIVGNSGTIKNCYCNGKVTGNDYTAGIIGYGGQVENSYNRSHVSGNNCVGGINGRNAIIINCYNEGKIEGKKSVGGIVGYRGGDIINCYNIGEISGNNNVGGIEGTEDNGKNKKIFQCYNIGKVSGNDCIGGIMGYAWITELFTIEQCYNTGEISGNNKVGGIGGDYGAGANCKIINCYNKGKILGKMFGGISGGNNTNTKYVSCYNVGELEGNIKFGISYKGVVENCYYLTGKGSSTETAMEFTDEELKNLATTLDKTYTIDDENNTITINENTAQNVWKSDTENKNEGYPIFMWQE